MEDRLDPKVPYKAAIFDSGGTISSNYKVRSDTLLQTLANLEAAGVKIFVIAHHSSSLPSPLDSNAIINGNKATAIALIRTQMGLSPNECIYLGDSEKGDGYAAKKNGVEFVLVPTFEGKRYGDPDYALEKILGEKFGERIFGENAPKILAKPEKPKVSELPKPKCLVEPPKPKGRLSRLLRYVGIGKRS